MPNPKAETGASPFLGLEPKTDQHTEKANEISPRETGLEPADHTGAGKVGSDPFLGTIRFCKWNLSLQSNDLKQSPSAILNYCSSTLLQQYRFQSSANRYHTTVRQLSDCHSRLYHQTVKCCDSNTVSEPSSDDSSISSISLSGSALGASAMPRHVPSRSSLRMVSTRSPRHVRPHGSGLIIRNTTFYARWMIPRSLQSSLGKTHFVKSLRTKNLNDARRLLKIAGWEYEEFLRGAVPGSSAAELRGPAKAAIAAVSVERAGRTFQEVFELFLADPTRSRTKKTIAGYREGIEVIYSVIGRGISIADIDREACRRLLDTLQWLPTNSPKKFPTLTAAQAAKMAKQRGRKDLLGPVTINSYMITLSSIMNFAINEEMIERNPCRGLRVIDPVKKRDKRQPFSDQQLTIIFNSYLYRTEIEAHRNTARFWVFLIALYAGMRLNEICALDLADVQIVEKVPCFLIREGRDKSIKTDASERYIPVHHRLIELGFLRFIEHQKATGNMKVFPELAASKNGHYSVEFSKWFGRFTRQIAARQKGDLTCFYSARHNFRDRLREAKISQEIALALGGWASSTAKVEVHSNYGRGFAIATLKEALDKISYPNLDLSHLVTDFNP